MQIILTHEQADFDALASLLAAHLLDEDAVPVLPRRMNRNVRAFLTLYGGDLPFIDPRDLPSGPIEAVTLVDTQSMVSIKGMGPETIVRVIDHHQRRENIPEIWSVDLSELGANTTVLIEALRERNGVFSAIQATLFLLGIYEDTGSLTYSRTTPRDVRAAAYLLELGASLKIANDFLNHPLSNKQQALYDHLRSSAEHLRIHGHNIIVASGDALEIDEELSTIAHKLRDLLDPDALFLLLTTRSGVQLIARSTSDNIDVSAVVSNFGGGGHERAAAALIRDGELESVHDELEQILPRFVQPAIKVSQIMSRGPQLLSPDTTAETAAERMRRYGYEGYPVVQRGKVIGLLTRRAVDRALSHQLNKPASSLMEAGEYHVYPGDSIEHLQRLMTDSGWGQIPVVNPENGEIIGIVTRTDLLKTLTPSSRVPSPDNLANRLEAALPPARLALIKAVAYAAYEQRSALYIVGGFVRDLLLNRPSIDFDLVVEGDAISLARALARKFGGRVTTHARFGTAKWHISEIQPQLSAQFGITPARANISSDRERKTHWPTRLVDQKRSHARLFAQPSESAYEDIPETLDLVTARTEFYNYPSALPTIERGSIKLDLHRRDFTINTMALRLDGHHYGELHDYWGGLNDLNHRLVRVLHSLSFVDDPTRMLRAVRFEKRFDFYIEERTLDLLKEAISLLDRVSGDRIRHELNHIFAEKQAHQIMARLRELGLLQTIHPTLQWDRWLSQRFQALQEIEPGADWQLETYKTNKSLLLIHLSYVLLACRQPGDQVLGLSKRLKLSTELRTAALESSKLWQDLPNLVGAKPSAAVRRLATTPPLARYAVYLASSDPHRCQVLENYAARWRKINPTIDGHDLRMLGLPPGPVYRRILEALHDAWLDGEVNSREQEMALTQKLIHEIELEGT
jgi:tRNA nucleotidyltransferase (CCA-adding enzyme)